MLLAGAAKAVAERTPTRARDFRNMLTRSEKKETVKTVGKDCSKSLFETSVVVRVEWV